MLRDLITTAAAKAAA